MKLFQPKLLAFLLVILGAVSSSGEARRSSSLTVSSKLVPTASTTKDVVSLTEKPTATASDNAMSLVALRAGALGPQAGQAAIGTAIMAAIEYGTKKILEQQGLKFPAQLGGCIVLFFFLVISEMVVPGSGDAMFRYLTPATTLLTKWLGVMFVPGLTMLPLAPSVGSNLEIAKVVMTVVLGFVFTLFTVSFSVLSLRTAQGAIKKPARRAPTATSVPKAGASAPKAFSDELFKNLLTGTALSGAISIAATKAGNEFATPLQTIFFLFATVAGYVWGAGLPGIVTKVFHPLVISSLVSLLTVRGTAMATGQEFLDVLKTYKVGSLAPMEAGAGDILLYFLGPAVVSFAVSMYSRKKLLAENFLVVLAGTAVSSVGGLFGTAAFVRAICLGGTDGSMVRLSILSRNVTTALAMAITSLLGGNVSIGASITVLTSIVGGTYGKMLLNAVGITDPVSRGMGIGSSAMGLGAASLAGEPDAFPFAAISLSLTAILSTILVSIPAVKDTLISLATSSVTETVTAAV